MTAVHVYNPIDFGAQMIDGEDITAPLQAAINAARAHQGGRGATVEWDSGYYRVSRLDCTHTYGLRLDGHGSWLYACNQTSEMGPSPVFDFTGSANLSIRGITVVGQIFKTAAPPPVMPSTAFLFASSSSGYDSGCAHVFECHTLGSFSSAALSIISSPDNAFWGCILQQDNYERPCLMISTNPDWGVTSPFAGITQTPYNTGDQTFEACEFHGHHGPSPGSYWTTYMRSADNVRFRGGVHDCSGTAHMLFQGNCHTITSDAQKFYSESGTPADYVFMTDSSCPDLCIINPNKGDNAYRISFVNGNFPNNRLV